MPTDVVMPQMGESIAEGTIVRWIKKVGDTVDRDEPLFEISTDKVDAEIPSPAAGVVAEIRAQEGETVPVNSVVAIIAPTGAASVSASAPKTERTERATAPAKAAASPAGSSGGVQRTEPPTQASRTQPSPPRTQHPTQAPPSTPVPRPQPTAAAQGGSSGSATARTPEPASTTSGERAEVRQPSGGVERKRSSPLVRKIAKEH